MNETRWQYYGTASTQGNLTLTWNTLALPTNSITVELWGYEETGEASRVTLGCLCGAWWGQEFGACRDGRKGIPGGGNPGGDF